ncbi:hypothetical protein BEP19_12165 [Ammoniphilus oxalaticus]|uniref:Uncharacterized protein n=1 Tax=Ammoniphilus oxalaticus TaxID=66863 RepID=A0A419SGR8_9BACL|nr:hypothetical protein [Ammoniphilus oxalaticus]RKD22979.1 hypothetical protein BEP19_12165 [Ammoniphilus oxalaticus]
MTIISNFLSLLLPIIILFMIVRACIGKTTLKFTHWMLSIYLGVLLLSTALAPFIKNNALELERVDRLEMNQAWSQLNTKLSNGQLDQIDSSFLLEEKSIDLMQTESMDIVWSGRYGDALVYVERKKESDGKLDVFMYAEGLWIDGYDFSHELEPLRVNLQTNNDLYIAMPYEQHLKVGLISDVFPLKQIKGDSKKMSHVTSGSQVIYLRIPPDLSIGAGEHIRLHMIEK